MPGRRLPMRKRLRAGGMSKRKIAASLSIGVTAAGDSIRRARRAGLSWPLPADISDEALERLVYRQPAAPAHDRGHERPQALWGHAAGPHSRVKRFAAFLSRRHRGSLSP